MQLGSRQVACVTVKALILICEIKTNRALLTDGGAFIYTVDAVRFKTSGINTFISLYIEPETLCTLLALLWILDTLITVVNLARQCITDASLIVEVVLWCTEITFLYATDTAVEAIG